METLKQRYFVVLDKRKYGGKRVAISINRLADYIPENRANFIIKNLAIAKDFPKRYSVQNKARIDIYLK